MAKEDAIEMFVGGLVLDPATQAPILLLKSEKGDVCLPIWIGIAEATSIATVLKNISLARPMTHDLMYQTLLKVGLGVQRVLVSDLRDGTYYAELVLGQGDRAVILDARPSDAIAIALRASAPIFVSKVVLERARVAMENASSAGEESKVEEQEGVEEDVINKGVCEKDFNSIDREKWSKILAELDPDDFKYKM
ncbi:MAG: bifunctional nuclease family protein [Candidatus Dadabacteria bacterium]|nr:MAG: bifunctional nuclease family protein [Candidatus Dadabacteria bacterium]